MIAKGEKDYSDVLNFVLEVFKKKYQIFVEKLPLMDKYFAPIFKTFDDAVEESRAFTKCGECKRYMRIIERTKKLHC